MPKLLGVRAHPTLANVSTAPELVVVHLSADVDLHIEVGSALDVPLQFTVRRRTSFAERNVLGHDDEDVTETVEVPVVELFTILRATDRAATELR